jgi:hypothetical protein
MVRDEPLAGVTHQTTTVDVRRYLPLLAACALHAGAFGVLGHIAASSVPLAPVAVRPDTAELDLDPAEALVALPEPPAAPLANDPPGVRAVRERESRADRVAAKSSASSPGLSAKSVESEPAPPTSPEPTATAWSFSPAGTAIDVHAAITPDLVTPASPTSRAPTASTTGGVAEGLAARDVELGLGRGGPILTAVENATRTSDDMVEGSATFDVAVYTDGAVVAQLINASGTADAWSRVADSIGRSVDARRVRLPAGRRGWRVVVHVDVANKLTDGRDVRTLHGLRASIAPSALSDQIEGKPGSRGSSTAPGGPDDVEGGPPPVGGVLGRGPANGGGAVVQGLAARVLPTPTISVSGKICSASLTVTPLGIGLSGGCSVENIGMPVARVVSGKIVSESAL